MSKLEKMLCLLLTVIIGFTAAYAGEVFAENENEDDFHDFLMSSYPIEDHRDLGSYTVSYVYTPGGTPVYAR